MLPAIVILDPPWPVFATPAEEQLELWPEITSQEPRSSIDAWLARLRRRVDAAKDFRPPPVSIRGGRGFTAR